LKWVEINAPDEFVSWTEFEHPDFPGKKVEIGGFAPFAKSNPPAKLLDGLAARHSKFLTELAEKFPRLAIRQIEAKHLGESVFEITMRIENTGYLPTALAQGCSRVKCCPRASLKLDDKEILSGRRTTPFGAIEGSGGSRELRWVVHTIARMSKWKSPRISEER
jgi:hypothetical protein